MLDSHLNTFQLEMKEAELLDRLVYLDTLKRESLLNSIADLQYLVDDLEGELSSLGIDTK